MRQHRQRKRAFTLLELLVVLSVIAVIAAILLPVLSAARERGRAADCQAKLRQVSLAMLMYADDYGGSLPLPLNWEPQLLGYLHASPPFGCPDVPGPPPNPRALRPGDILYGYAYNHVLTGKTRGPLVGLWDDPRARPLSGIPYPATTVALCDACSQCITVSSPVLSGGGIEQAGLRHHGGANYAFLDGHVKWYRPEQVQGGGWLAPIPDGKRPSFRPY